VTTLDYLRSARKIAPAVLLGMSAASALAQQPSAAQVSAIKQACRSDYMANCSGVPTGGAAALSCLTEHAAQASTACQQALSALATTTSPAMQSRPAAAGAKPSTGGNRAATPVAGDWPHTVALQNGSATVYEPQIISWPDRRTLNTRIALGITPTGAKTPTLGTIEVAFTSDTDLTTRTVTLTDAKLTSSHFPTLDTSAASAVEANVRTALANVGAKTIPLDTVLLSLNQNSEKAPDVALKNDPPTIFFSDRPASLLVFDGEPVLAPVEGTSLSSVVNTNWPVFTDANKAWYWLNNGGWLTASTYSGPWEPVVKLPAEFSKIPNDGNGAELHKSIPGRAYTRATMPTVFVSTAPAQIIITDGTPKFAAIAGTPLKYATNTNAYLFVDGNDHRYYFLASGRWFSAAQVSGPWTFATTSLPADFALIPANSPAAVVLASVPGTPQAQEALIQAQIPQQATLKRASATLDVAYSGPPRFEPITGTEMQYAVNTGYDVIRVGNVYYAVWQGAWFMAPTATGPWTLADTIPAVIYTIPPSSPLYPVTYVRVYDVTPQAVTYGYTAGYTMGYISAGVVVYGTGYYYPPVIIAGPTPIYYPYPYSYAGSVWYNSSTGAWARGGTIYGPYGGAATGGSYYNPNTGAYARGGAVYGPNGGAGAWQAYNPTTGRYAQGSASWNGSSGTANASFYNNRTGVAGATNQNYNQYGRWGSSVVSTPNQTVHTQSGSNANGSAGSFNSTTGAKGAGVSGANGNSAGVVKGQGGNVYAGANGNVYKKTDDGWSKWNDGSWSQPDKAAANSANRNNVSGQTQTGSYNKNLSGATQSTASQARSNSSGNISGQTERGSQFRNSDEYKSLNQDSQARTMGAQRQQNYNQMRTGGAGGRSVGGGGGGFGRR
jgi:hypothetical protein